ncbi:MAG: hypothetical protein IJD16_09125 [Desulfovibrio sp.]|nr:hypothetical protein [Desulfovibrio sp.]
MVSPDQHRLRLKEFLKQRVEFYRSIYRQVAEAKVESISAITENRPSIDDYIINNSEIIEKETDKVLDKFCAEIIPGKQYRYIFTQISLFSIFLLPAIYPLSRYAIILWREPDFKLLEFSFCIVSILLLLTIICASAVSVFMSSSVPKK